MIKPILIKHQPGVKGCKRHKNTPGESFHQAYCLEGTFKINPKVIKRQQRVIAPVAEQFNLS
jgi:hypothetical protein